MYTLKDKKTETFTLEYLYLEDYPVENWSKESKEKEEEEQSRGVVTIDIF